MLKCSPRSQSCWQKWNHNPGLPACRQSSTLYTSEGMRAENGQEDQDGSVTIKLQETTWKSEPALSLHCSQHNMVLQNLEWRGSEVGPGMLYGFCSWLTFMGPSLFPLRKHNELFFHSVETPQLTTAPQRTPLLLDLPCQCLDSTDMGWSLRSCSLAASLNIAVLRSEETPH